MGSILHGTTCLVFCLGVASVFLGFVLSAASNVLIIRCVSGNGFALGSQLVLCIGKLCANVSVEPWFSQDAPQTAVVSDNCAGLMCDTMCPMR